ncbi:hypothetical protein SAMN04487955_107113 [Halomonas korlensis]|uniref:Uncharacterized protein n=1 Tax=Halomonas korlensis TaxID=463301 RepID=A0A1I7ILG9_9GAMM|nr:hypothetical protein SAMN04487955_107113 [Halomonas korlensis]
MAALPRGLWWALPLNLEPNGPRVTYPVRGPCVVSLICITLCLSFGMAIGRWLDTPRAWRVFNGVMVALTAACVIFILG